MKPSENEKKLRINYGRCTRLEKEIASYVKERETEMEKLSEMKKNNADAYDVKQMEEVVKQTERMIPLVEKEYDKALNDLYDLVDSMDGDESVTRSEQWKAVQEYLKNKEEQ
ncbi:hypothetical protein WA577_006826, partial [Blastocystis sp. JDR]